MNLLTKPPSTELSRPQADVDVVGPTAERASARWCDWQQTNYRGGLLRA